MDPTIASRAERHAALGDPARLAIIDELCRSDRAPVELLALVGLPSNLLAHHLDVLDQVGPRPPLVITVCDRAHEELHPDPTWLHWSIPDPVPLGTPAAFDAIVAELRDRITALVDLPEAA